ncbi:MAG: alpha-mannosidase [Oscillospiraceae bacterium]
MEDFLKSKSHSALTLSSIGHGHLDLAWLWPIRETKRKAARTISRVLYNLERNPGYIYGISQLQQLDWLKNQYPTLFEKAKKAIAAGQIEIQGATWAEMDTNMPSGEALIRHALLGKKFLRDEFDRDVNICWLPDTFGYSGNLPQILNKSGMDYFSTIKLAWNRVNVFPHRTFYWKGIDDTSVLVHMPPEGDYNSGASPHHLLKAEDRYPEKDLGEAMLVFGGGDGGGGPNESHFEFINREKDLYGLPKVKYSTTKDFFERISKKKIETTYKGELYLETHQGTLTTQAKNKYYNRLSERLLHNAEAIGTIAHLAGGEYPKAFLEKIWKEVLLYQFHDIIPGSSITRVHKESVARYKKLTAALRLYLYNALAKTEGDSLAAVNLTSFTRNEAVKHEDTWYTAKLLPYSAAKLKPVKNNYPELKYSAYAMSNDMLQLKFSRSGEIVSCIDSKGRQHAKQYLNRLTVFKDKIMVPFNAWDIDAKYRTKPHVNLRVASFKTYVDGPTLVRVQRYIYPKFSIIQKIVLEMGSDVVTFDTVVNWQECNHMLRAEFLPTNYSGTAKFDIQFGYIERPTTNKNKVEEAQFEVCAHKWAAVEDREGGFAVLNNCKYGYHVKESVVSLNLLRAPIFPDKTADRGLHRFKYAFCPFEKNDIEYVVKQGYALNNPLLVAKTKTFDSLVSVSTPNIIAETIKLAENGNDIVLRLYESCGKNTSATVTTSLPFKAAFTSSMIEEREEETSLENLSFTPFEVKTILLCQEG